MAAPKRTRGVDYDFEVKQNDPVPIANCLTLVMPGDLKGFINGMNPLNVEKFYTSVMSQKNSDRIFRLFLEEVPQLSTMQAGNNKKWVGCNPKGFFGIQSQVFFGI